MAMEFFNKKYVLYHFLSWIFTWFKRKTAKEFLDDSSQQLQTMKTINKSIHLIRDTSELNRISIYNGIFWYCLSFINIGRVTK